MGGGGARRKPFFFFFFFLRGGGVFNEYLHVGSRVALLTGLPAS